MPSDPLILQISPSTGIELNPSVGSISSQYGIDLNLCSAAETALDLGTFLGIYGFGKDKAAGQVTGCILQSSAGGWLRCSRFIYTGRGEGADFADFGVGKSDNESCRNPELCFPARQSLCAHISPFLWKSEWFEGLCIRDSKLNID